MKLPSTVAVVFFLCFSAIFSFGWLLSLTVRIIIFESRISVSHQIQAV